MFNVNDTILYGVYGVCRIVDITEKEMNGKTIEYYELKPVYDKFSTVYVPTHNEVLTNKMRKILSAQEIYALIKAMPKQSTLWIDNEIERKEQYKQILSKGDRKELIQLIKTLYIYKQRQSEIGKKLHASDEVFLKDAEKMLYEEFAHVLNINFNQVVPFIMNEIEIEEKKKA